MSTNSATIETDENVIITDPTVRPYNKEYCDACGSGVNARAAHVVVYEASELSFCNHHYQKNAKHFADSVVIQLV